MKKIARLFGKLYFFEKLALAYAVFALVFMRSLGMRLVYMENYFYYEVFTAIVIGYLMLAAYMFYLIAKRFRSGRAQKVPAAQRLRSAAADTAKFMGKAYFNAPFIGDGIRPMLAVIVILVFFCNLKQAIPIVNPALFDKEMWAIDKILHFGASPTLVSLKWLGPAFIARALDGIYVTFFIMNVIVPIVFILQRRSKNLRDQFFTAFCLSWVIGGLSYYIFPALGPCYYKPGLFSGLDAPLAKKLQELLLYNYNNLRADPHGYISGNFYGIAAMPSLHLAKIALFAMFAAGLNRFFSAALWIYLALMFAGSVLLGWHYAVDGYAGIFLAFIIYALVTKKAGRSP